MKSMIFLAGIICLFTSVSAFADVDPSMQPQQITSKSPFVKKIVEELKGKKLNCAPVNAKDNDATYYPLTITMSENAQGASELSVANVKGEDGLSNCCARVSYSSKKGVLRLLDGDDDNYMDLNLQIDVSGSSEKSGRIKAVRRSLEDDKSVSSQADLICTIQK